MALNFKCLSSTINLYHAGYFCVHDVVHYLTKVFITMYLQKIHDQLASGGVDRGGVIKSVDLLKF